MKIYLRASLIALVFAGILISIYFTLTKSGSQNAPNFDKIEAMETQGVPDFKFTTLKGNESNLSSLKGKVVLINFWASWCAPCIEEIPSMIKLAEKYGDQIEIIAISADAEIAEVNNFLKSFPEIEKPNIHIVWDEKKELMQLFEIDRLPESFLTNKDLKLARKILGSINWISQDTTDYIDKLVK